MPISFLLLSLSCTLLSLHVVTGVAGDEMSAGQVEDDISCLLQRDVTLEHLQKKEASAVKILEHHSATHNLSTSAAQNLSAAELTAATQHRFSRVKATARMHNNKRREFSHADLSKQLASEPSSDDGEVSLAVFIFLITILIAVVFAMAHHSHPRISNTTITAMDNIVSIYFAVLFYNLVGDFMKRVDPFSWKLAGVIATIMLLFVMIVAWCKKSSKEKLAIDCACGAHFVSFGWWGASKLWQMTYYESRLFTCACGLIPLFCTVFGTGVVLYLLKKVVFGVTPGDASSESKVEGAAEFVDRFDDVETDSAAMVMVTYLLALLCFALTGKFPEEAGDIDPGDEHIHTDLQRNLMLLFTLFFIIYGNASVTERPKTTGELSYFKKRTRMFHNSFQYLLIAFSCLEWGKMQFYEATQAGINPLYTRCMFAGGCSLLGITLIYVLSFFDVRPAVWKLNTNVISMTVGFTWEEVYEEAIDSAFDDMRYRIGMLVATIAIIFPIYYIKIKPIALSVSE